MLMTRPPAGSLHRGRGLFDRQVHRSRASWLLLVLVLAGAVLTTIAATRSLLTVSGVLAVDPDLTTSARERAASQGATGLLGPLDSEALRTAEGISLLISLPVAVVCLVLLLGLATWRAWALDSVLGVYGLVGALLVLFSAAGLSNGAPNAAVGLVVGLVALGMAALAVCPPVRADADRIRIAAEVRERQRLKALREGPPPGGTRASSTRTVR